MRIAVAVAVLGIGGALGPAGLDVARGSPPRAAAVSVGDAELIVRAAGRSLRLGPRSFCAAPNGEPVTLACVHATTAPPEALAIRPGIPLTLRLGVAAKRVTLRYVQLKGDRIGAGAEALSVAPTTNPRLWRAVPPRASLLRGRPALVVTVQYRDGVRLGLLGRLSSPFLAARAEFAFRLVRTR